MVIKNVIICGLGALGLTYANKLKSVCNLKILADFERVEKYKKYSPIFNNEKINLNYITPVENFDADLIIISTKSTGLNSAIQYIKNFVNENTIIISLINGISSEEKISAVFPQAKVLRSYFIGHSAIGINEDGKKKYFQDGVGKIVFEPNSNLETFFKISQLQNITYNQKLNTKKIFVKAYLDKSLVEKFLLINDDNINNYDYHNLTNKEKILYGFPRK